jgi:hypothetical protein
MRGTRFVLVMLLGAGLACQSDKSVPEAGAVLVKVKCATGAPTPDELRVWVYDDRDRLWDGVRVPDEGPLVVASPQNLGTILIAPGQIQGKLRVHVRGLLRGGRALDGMLNIAAPTVGDRTYDVLLLAELPLDADGDDVPDAIDDCPSAANPAQGGCPSLGALDAAIAPDGAADLGRDARSQGSACSANSECQSGFCKDGACCDTACTDACFACGTGVCLSVRRTDDAPECTGAMSCNSRGRCVTN